VHPALVPSALSRIDQALQHAYIALFVAGLVYWRLGDEGRMCEAFIVQQAPEGLYAHGSLADVLVPVEL
jgi:hypothetical protein